MPGLWVDGRPLAAQIGYYSCGPDFTFGDVRRMPNPRSFLRVFTESGPLLALTVAIALLVGIAGPASAQFFNFGNFGAPQRPPQPIPQQRGGGWFGNDMFAPFRQEAPRRQVVREDFSKAPPP